MLMGSRGAHTAALQKVLPWRVQPFQDAVRPAHAPDGSAHGGTAVGCVLELATVFEVLRVKLKGGSGVAAY